MKKKTLKVGVDTIVDTIAEMDYIFVDTFPLIFNVTNNDETHTFEAGMGKFDDYEVQYLSTKKGKLATKGVIDIQDPDAMSYENIEKMVKQCCDINDESIITIDLENSFDGHYANFNDFEADDVYELFEKYDWNNHVSR